MFRSSVLVILCTSLLGCENDRVREGAEAPNATPPASAPAKSALRFLEIPDGTRAVTFLVKREVTDCLSLRPGDRVDLIGTSREGDDAGISSVVLEDVFIIQIGGCRMWPPDDEKEFARYCQTELVTVALTPVDCHTLSLAQQQGEIRIALRARAPKEHQSGQNGDQSRNR
jgi:Flp pilus assembly protein CpaB